LEQTTATRTIAHLIADSAKEFGGKAAVMFKRDGSWHELSYSELGAIVQEVALGLIELGIKPGERLAILANTRPEWSYADLAAATAGIVVVPIYPTNSPEECHWVLHDSGASAVVCENADQLAKIEKIWDQLPKLRYAILIDPPEGWSGATERVLTLEELRARGREGNRLEELEGRRDAVKPSDTLTIIYTSGTTGPPKGCVLAHGNYRAILDILHEVRRQRGIDETAELVYLYLPLAHSYALLVQLFCFDSGQTIAYYGGDIKQIVAELSEVRPTYLPSVPRIFEKIYTLVCSHFDPEYIKEATKVGMAVKEAEARGEEVPEELRARYAEFDERLFKNVRAVFGGRLREAASGAAPIAKEILEFFFAAGVPVMEGYGMTETSTVATYSTPEAHRFGSIGRPLPGVEAKIAPDGELLIRGPNVFQGYYNRAEQTFGAIEDGWLHTGDLAHMDEDGYIYIDGRKKDIIITAGGKNITPANLENEMRQSRWVSQAVMLGDRRPYPIMLITLDQEEIIPWAQAQGLPTEMEKLVKEPKVRELIQAELDKVNSHYARVEQVKRFAILPHDFTQEGGELTPTLKVKRQAIAEKYAKLIDEIYAQPS